MVYIFRLLDFDLASLFFYTCLSGYGVLKLKDLCRTLRLAETANVCPNQLFAPLASSRNVLLRFIVMLFDIYKKLHVLIVKDAALSLVSFMFYLVLI